MGSTRIAAERTREAILDAAASFFLQGGVSRATLAQIAAKAGVTRGAIYWHFKDKDALLRALIEDARLPHEDLIEPAFTPEGVDDPLLLIEEACRMVLEALSRDERQQRIHAILSLRYEATGEHPDVTARLTAAMADAQARLLQMVRSARDKGQLSPQWSAETAAWSIHCTITGLFHEWLRNDRAFSLTEVGTAAIGGLMSTMRIGDAPHVPSLRSHTPSPTGDKT